MNLEMEAYPGELEKLRFIVKKIYAEQLPDQYFICGEIGTKDDNGLPDKLMVCPAYGVDWFQLYTKTDETAGTEW